MSTTGSSSHEHDVEAAKSTEQAPVTLVNSHDNDEHHDEKAKESVASNDAPVTPATDASKETPAGPPDGGLEAWLVVVGGFIALFCSFGFLNNFAAFQTYYFENTLRGYSNSDISWIGALQSFAILASNLLLGPLFDKYGPRPLLIVGTLLFSFGCMMTSLSDKYYQIILAQGVVIGASLGAIFIVPIAITMQWFNKLRPAALGIVISGSSIGGVVWPIITYQLLTHVGFGWTWRALGFMVLGLLCIPIFTIHSPKYALEAKKNQPPRTFLHLSAFKVKKYSGFTIAYVFFAFGLFPLLFFFPELCASYGVSAGFDFYVISILNAFSFIGRLGLPVLSQRTGVWNTTIVTILCCAIVVFASMAIDSAAGSVVAAGAFGFTSGGALSLVVSLVPTVVVDFKQIGAEMGAIFFCGSIAALITGPIAGWIEATKEPGGNWIAVEGYVGGCLILTTILLIALRTYIKPDWRTKF